MTVKASISLTDEQDRYARSLVEQGRFSSLSAVVQRGLEALQRDDEKHAAEIRALDALLTQRLAEPSVPLEDNFDDFMAAVDGAEREGHDG